MGFAAAEPPQAHVHGFYVLCYGGEVGDANISSVVIFQGFLRLRPSHFYESVTQGGHFLGGNIESVQFGFSGR